MSPIAAGLDAILALLLLLALGLGVKLNGRLKALREGQSGFAAAVIELNQAAARAEAGLAALKTASESAHDDLLARIETARALAIKLERASGEAQRVLAQRTPEAALERPEGPARAPGPSGTLAAIAALAQGRSPERPAAGDSRPATSALRRPLRASVEDDLFETKTHDRGDLGPLRAPRGDR